MFVNNSYVNMLCSCVGFVIVKVGFVTKMVSEWPKMVLKPSEFHADYLLTENLIAGTHIDGIHSCIRSPILFCIPFLILLFYEDFFYGFALEITVIGLFCIIWKKLVYLACDSGFVLDSLYLQSQEHRKSPILKHVNGSNRDITLCIATLH